MLTVAGLTPSLDLTYLVDSLTLGEIHRVPKVIRCAGGKSLNMARAARTMGADSTVVALLGGATGAALAEMLAAEGIAMIEVHSARETRICVSIAAADSGQLTEIYQEAAPVAEDVWQAFLSQVRSVLVSRPGWLSVSGRAPQGAPRVIAELVRTAHLYEVQVAVDTHGQALPEALTERPTLVKINRSEAAELLGVPIGTDLLTMAIAVRRSCGAIVVLTDGTAGALAVDGAVALQATGPDVVGRYPVGSGDSFLGGLLASLEAGESLGEALRTATACGVANALVPGQGHFDVDAVARIAPAVTVRPVGS